MADHAGLIVTDAPSIIKKLMKNSETECQRCAELKLELNDIGTELKTTIEIIEIIEILKEGSGMVDELCDGNTSIGQNSENESQISPSENNRIQM
jgi:hypothetical protein